MALWWEHSKRKTSEAERLARARGVLTEGVWWVMCILKYTRKQLELCDEIIFLSKKKKKTDLGSQQNGGEGAEISHIPPPLTPSHTQDYLPHYPHPPRECTYARWGVYTDTLTSPQGHGAAADSLSRVRSVGAHTRIITPSITASHSVFPLP